MSHLETVAHRFSIYECCNGATDLWNVSAIILVFPCGIATVCYCISDKWLRAVRWLVTVHFLPKGNMKLKWRVRHGSLLLLAVEL